MTRTGTIKRVPRASEVIPDDIRQRLLDAQADADAAQDRLRAEVRYALSHGGSVRTVAAVLGMSPTTVQKWKDTSVI